MSQLKNITNIFFIGIGGIGMSALARYFRHKGVCVSGYDKTPTPLTRLLEAEGITVVYSDDEQYIDAKAQLVVYTPAIPSTQRQLVWYQQHGYEVVKRSDVLKIITESSFNICVAGTHGKTSISTMIAHILRDSGYGCNAFLGGISANYGTNFWAADNEVCVVEADEYDRSFLKLSPDVAVITSMDADHLDIYHTHDAVQSAFIEFAGKIKSGGILVRHQSLHQLEVAMVKRQLSYRLTPSPTIPTNDHNHQSFEDIATDIFAESLVLQNGGYTFSANIAGEVIADISFKVGGLHNVENVLAAITVAKLLKIPTEAIKRAVTCFKGVKRRFEYITPPDAPIVFIDDYAHHPQELLTLISSVKDLFPNKTCTVIFQPHLYSRTRDFASEFAQVLDLADEALVLPLYPAREMPMEGVSSQTITQWMTKGKLQSREEVLAHLSTHLSDVIVTAGAGDIDALVPQIYQLILQKQQKKEVRHE